MTRALAMAVMLFISLGAKAQAEMRLALPVGCETGKTCFVQQYVDADPGPGAKDYRCGGQTYNGHKGTDIRVRSLADAHAGVNVLAAAAGTVQRRRDDMPDRLVRTGAEKQAVAKRACGNGVLIDHGDGWQTQYCHLRKGSVQVAPGQTVRAGDVLGEIGYSGDAAFAHVHLTVRKNGEVVDPFAGLGRDPASCGLGQTPLWSPAALETLSYREGQILDTGFASGAPKLNDLETGKLHGTMKPVDDAALVAWGWAINLQKGDRVAVVLRGPGGQLAHTDKMLDRNKAQYFLFAGKKRPAAGWPKGRYTALFAVQRNGENVLRAGRAFVVQ